MATCPNTNLQSWKDLVASRGEDVAYYLWDKYKGNVPEVESGISIVKSGIKATNILQSLKAIQLFNTLQRNNVKGDAFWNKLQQDLQISKEQIDLLKQYNTTNREELVTNMLADYSYAIEINLSTEKIGVQGSRPGDPNFQLGEYFYTSVVTWDDSKRYFKLISPNDRYSKSNEISKEEYQKAQTDFGRLYEETVRTQPTQVYSNLTVPGGTNYTENEIATPAITPSIKGHAQFATDKGIGWFRSDDKTDDTFTGEEYDNEDFGIDPITGESITRPIKTKITSDRKITKTRRILEVQSDLFQKGRDLKVLEVPNKRKVTQKDIDSGNLLPDVQVGDIISDYETITKGNQFLQLLNKGANWVTFFVKSIIQDSAKKGYEKVLFPSGNTAGKIEKFDKVEEKIQEFNDKLKKIPKANTIQELKDIVTSVGMSGGNLQTEKEWHIKKINDDLNHYLAAQKNTLSTINFYENTVANVLKKQGYNPKQVTDEYGNTWNEIVIVAEREEQPIFLQKEETEASKASPATIAKVKQILEKMGVTIKDLATYAREAGLDSTGINGVADVVAKVIALAEGKEDVALTEEMVHIATAILEQKNPQLVTQMISKIDRFQIYQRTLDEYKNNPAYQLPNGKPNIRKIKKEAVDKLIAELIVYNNEGTTEFPELLDETNRSLIRNFFEKILDWFRGMYKSANIDIFQEAAAIVEEGVEGDVIGMESDELYYQLSDPQKAIQQRLLQTRDAIKKVEDKKNTDAILMDTEEASNWYETQQSDGTWGRVAKRVTDRVKAWYKQRFPGKVFTEEEKRFNEFKRQAGVKGHGFFEEIHGRYFNSDGTRKKNVEPRKTKLSRTDDEIYTKLENYFTELVAKFSENGKNPLVFSEMIIYDPKEKEAGTIDLLIIEENGKANIIDWKFMNVAEGAKDVAWFKQGAYDIQLGRYKDILRDRYGVKEVGMNRAIPILMKLKQEDAKNAKSPMVMTGIAIGSVDATKIEDLRLIPVSEQTESTGFERLDKLIKLLNAAYKQISKEVVTDEDEREFKRDRLNTLKQAIRIAQGTLNIAPLVDVIKIIRKEGDQILDDYKTTYEGRPANSKGEDFTDEKLSDFAASMREYNALSTVFGRVDDLIGDLIYNSEMEKEATTEEAKEELAERKELLDNIRKEAANIRRSSEEIFNASGKFADKFIGQKNLVTGLLSPEAVVKGLSSLFRGVSELPMASLQVLYKLVTNAKGRASRDALEEVDKLMDIRKRLVARGGDVRNLVQQIYQKDDKNKLVNKLIYKYQRKFFDDVDNNALEGNRSKKWLMENIDVEAYRKEAGELLKKKIERIEKLYDDPEVAERLIREEKNKWDIDNKNFIGWNNYIIKRHPLKKWESKEYIDLQKDADLLELYNFISKINDKAKQSGYISNKAASTFLPFIRKGMAESLAWDFDLSAVMNMGKNLSVRAGDVGYGQVNELTGELENAIPKYYTYDFTRGEDGVNDYSDVSEDIFKNMILYINHMEKYKYLSAVEDQIKIVKDIETFKGYLATNNIGDAVYDASNRPLALSEGNPTSEGNTKVFNDFMRALLYEQKYPLSDSDTPLGAGKVMNFMKTALNNVTGREIFKINENPSATSLVKTIDAANRAFQLKALGLEFISGAVNSFGANIQIATQAGNYFQAREVLANETKLIGNKWKTDDERNMFLQLIDAFMPLKDDPTYDKLQESGLTVATRANISDFLMAFMRYPEQHIEKSIFLTLLQNTMVEDGRIVSIREFVKRKYKDRYDSASKYREVAFNIEQEIEELKKTRSIDVTKKLVDGKLVIPGLDLNNTEELQRLTNLTRRISRNATGGLSDGDFNRMGLNIWTKSMMVFKNWIPKLLDTRFGEFRKVSDDFSVEIDEDGLTTGEKYDIGRIRLFAYVIGTSIKQRTSNIYNILSVNDKGLETLNNMYDEFAVEFEKRTGKPLNMDRDEFIDMVRTNLRNQIKELAILASLLGAAISLGLIGTDDDDDRADKNRFRYAQRVIDKFVSEVSFFYNPAEFQKILSGSMFPAIGIFSDFGRFVDNFMMEVTGLDTSNPELTPEQVRKKAQPIKNFGKMFPFTKSLFTYGAILDPEFAKEFDVTIQKESRR